MLLRLVGHSFRFKMAGPTPIKSLGNKPTLQAPAGKKAKGKGNAKGTPATCKEAKGKGKSKKPLLKYVLLKRPPLLLRGNTEPGSKRLDTSSEPMMARPLAQASKIKAAAAEEAAEKAYDAVVAEAFAADENAESDPEMLVLI